ncbi:MAG: spore photoproduct lyase family protein [bacterium]
MNFSNFSKIYLTEDAISYPLAGKIIGKCKNAKISYVKSPRELYFKPALNPEFIDESKHSLFLTARHENFLEKCPGTKENLCCNYFVTKNVLGCPADCSYCYLQAYLNKKAITIFVNTPDFFADFEEKANSGHFRIGTGEFSDSLFLDGLIDVNKTLVEICSKSKSLLELKTKSNSVEKLLGLNHRGKTVIAWSVNPRKTADSEEKGSSNLEERIAAAKKCADDGYHIALHFDPLIYSPGWEKDYEETIEKIFAVIPARKIIWVSIGAFRFYPQMKPVMRARFPASKILCGEFTACSDGKFRYLKFIRLKMFGTITALLQKFDRNMRIYFCMESGEIWRRTFSHLPSEIKNLDLIFKN